MSDDKLQPLREQIDVFPETDGLEETRCATMGVFAPLVGIIGTLQAAEALKLLSGMGSRLVGKLMLLEGLGMEFHTVVLGRDPGCAVCGQRN